MESFVSYKPMILQMGPQMQIPQHTTTLSHHTTSTISPDSSILPHIQGYNNSKVKRQNNENIKRDKDDDDDELLFDIDEFLEKEDVLIRRSSSIISEDAEYAAITDQSSISRNNSSVDSSVVSLARSDRGNNEDPDPTNTTAAIIGSPSSTRNTAVSKKKRKKRYKGKSKNKVDAPPKRPLSAYNLYFREERKRCLAEKTVDPKSKSKKYNFEELGKLIGRGWRLLPLKEKQELEARAEADRERYRNEMIAYRREKRRKDLEEDEDTIVMMRQQHQTHNTCPHSPTTSMSPHSTRMRRVITSSPYQLAYPRQQKQQGYPQDKECLYHEDGNCIIPDAIRKGPHVRKVSVSASTPPYIGREIEYRFTNNSSPAMYSCGSCSSWSGEEYEDHNGDHRSHKHKRHKDESIEDDGNRRDVTGTEARTERANDASTPITTNRRLPTKVIENPQTPTRRSHLHISRCDSGPIHESACAPSPAVPVARVIAMPSIAGLQRILRDGLEAGSPHSPHPSRPEQQSPPPPLSPSPSPQQAWTSYKHSQQDYHPSQHRHHQHPHHRHQPHNHHHNHNHHHHHQQEPYAPVSPPLTPDPRTYSLVPPPPPSHSSRTTPQQATGEPQILPLGMEIILRDPATGRDRSYRVHYTPKYMTAEAANQYHRMTHPATCGHPRATSTNPT